jgi:hypothetical protein
MSRVHTWLVFHGPHPHAAVDDPDAGVFTPEDALAVVKKYPRALGMRVEGAGPVTNIEAAVMPAREAYALVRLDVVRTVL